MQDLTPLPRLRLSLNSKLVFMIFELEVVAATLVELLLQ